MSSKKRPRPESDTDDTEPNTNTYIWECSDITKGNFITTLCKLLDIDSPEAMQDMRDTLRMLDGRLRSTASKKLQKRFMPLHVHASGFQSLWHVAQSEAQQDRVESHPKIRFKMQPPEPFIPHQLVSALQKRYLTNPSPVMEARMQRYFRALSILAYEHDHGIITEEYQVSMVQESVWTPAEKKRFFIALERCGRFNVVEIARRVGPTKTVMEVYQYLQLLANASKVINTDHKVKPLTAREMSPVFILQESWLAQQVEQTLETESYGKHLNVCQQPDVMKSNQLFELWNMSSIARLFAGTNEMTVLSSTTFNMHQLIKNFISDIMVDLHTQLLNSNDKTVSKSLMNLVIANRQRAMRPDPRLQDMDIMALLDRRFAFHEKYSSNKSASFLAKRRRMAYEHDQDLDEEQDEEQDEEALFHEFIQVSDEEQEQDSDSGEESDGMFDKFDTEDELLGRYVVINQFLECKEAMDEYEESNIINREPYVDFSIQEKEDDGQSDEYEEAEELEQQRLDTLHEEKLSKYLDFYNHDDILKKRQQK